MPIPTRTCLLRFSLPSIFLVVLLSALVVCWVVEPEIRRTETFDILWAQNAIQAPIVTLFEIPRPYNEPIPEPTWFSNRQRIAKILGVQTTPWHGECNWGYSSHETDIIRLASSCEEYAIWHARRAQFQ
jgi:hypothetical protein